MNYKDKLVVISGAYGFLGNALLKELDTNQGAQVIALEGDIRDPETFNQLSHEVDYYFHFAAPSSQILFKRNPIYCADTTINGFINAAKACRDNGIKIIYPSTGLLSQNSENEYARCKKLCEDMHLGENLNALGVRIFATYGPGEGHKADYASVPYLFARDMYEGKSPVIWGDGSQRRDFIYIADVVQGILTLAEKANEPIIDLGYGASRSFKGVIADLQAAFADQSGANIPEAVFIDKPKDYVEETAADTTILNKYFKPSYDMADGCWSLVKAFIDKEA